MRGLGNLISYHLRLLRDGGLVTSTRSGFDGRDSYYHLDLDRCADALNDTVAALHRRCANAAPPVPPVASRRSGGIAVLFVCTGNSARSPLSRSGSERITRVGWRWRPAPRRRWVASRFTDEEQPHEYRRSAVRECAASGVAVATGLAVFAGALMIVSGIGAVFEGIAAVFNDKVFVSTPQYLFAFDLTAWGWIHLFLGVLVGLAGVASSAGRIPTAIGQPNCIDFCVLALSTAWQAEHRVIRLPS